MSNVTYRPTDNTFGLSQLLNNAGQEALQKPSTTGTTGTDGTAGLGSLAQTGSAPDAVHVMMGPALMASIALMMPKMSDEDIDVAVTAITSKMKDAIDASDKDNIQNQQAKKEASIKQKLEKLKEAEQKINDAIKAQHSSNIFDKIKLAFEYIGAIMAIVAGIVALATSVVDGPAGAVAGALLITSGICLLTLAVDDTVAAATAKDGQPGMGMFGQMVKAIAKSEGKSDEEADKMAQKGEMGFKIGLMAIAIITGAVGAFLNPTGVATDIEETVVMSEEISDTAMGAAETEEMVQETVTTATEAADTADSASEVTDSATEIAEATDQAEATATHAERFELIAKFINNGQNILSAGAQIGSSVTSYQASDDQADARRAQADAKKLEALGKFLDDMIDMAIGRLKANGDRFNQVLDSVTDAMKDRADTMSHAKFKG